MPTLWQGLGFENVQEQLLSDDLLARKEENLKAQKHYEGRGNLLEDQDLQIQTGALRLREYTESGSVRDKQSYIRLPQPACFHASVPVAICDTPGGRSAVLARVGHSDGERTSRGNV